MRDRWIEYPSRAGRTAANRVAFLARADNDVAPKLDIHRDTTEERTATGRSVGPYELVWLVGSFRRMREQRTLVFATCAESDVDETLAERHNGSGKSQPESVMRTLAGGCGRTSAEIDRSSQRSAAPPIISPLAIVYCEHFGWGVLGTKCSETTHRLSCSGSEVASCPSVTVAN